jgi:hypothetical protein
MGNRTLVPNPTPAVPGGGMTLISETVASGLTGLSFSSIPSTYKQLMLVWHGVYMQNGDGAYAFRLNNDSGASAYGITLGAITGTTVASQCLNHSDMTYAGNYYSPFSPDDNTTTDYGALAKGYMVIDNYASTTKFKEYSSNFSWRFPGLSNQYVVDIKGTYKSTSAITSIDVVNIGSSCTFSNATSTSIRLYGIS